MINKSTFKQILRSKRKKPFYILVVGAHDGISHDYILDIFNSNNLFGLFVEPVKDYFTKLQLNVNKYQGIKCLNFAIGSSKSDLKIYKIKKEFEGHVPNWALGSASTNKQHLLDYGIEEEYLEAEVVKTIDFEELMEYYSYKKIDLIQIDVEGMDYEILKMINFHKYKPNYVRYEHMNLSEEDVIASRSYLLKNGYYFIVDGNDTIGKKNKIISSIFTLIYKYK